MKLFIHCGAALLAASTTLHASDPVVETTIVTATRTPVLLSEAFESITVFTRKEIDSLQAVDIFDLLSRAPGVSFVRNGGRGSSTSLSIRGNQGDHSLFLIDGVRIGSATLGSASLSALNLQLVERIEIIRGPKSALYGADAIGGVVNIVTRSMDKARPVAIEATYGSLKTNEYTAVAGFGTDTASVDVTASFFNTNGIDHTENTVGANGDKDAYRNTSFAVNYRQKLGDDVSLKLSYNSNEGENEYDANCADETTYAPVECFIYAETKVESLAVLMDYKVSSIYTTSLQLGRSKDESAHLADNVDLTPTFSDGEFNTTKSEATWLNSVAIFAGNTLIMGLDYQLDEVEGSTAYTVDSRDNTAGFGQLQSEFGAFNTIVGIRYDDNEQFGDATTVSALVGWDINEQLRSYVSFGEGFKPPTFNDLYYPVLPGSPPTPNFQPEESKSYELGLKANIESLDVSVAVFKNDITNLIQYNRAIRRSEQTAKASITGLEFSVGANWMGVDLSLNGSVIDPENKANGQNLRRRAERSVSLDIDTSLGPIDVGATIRAESERFDDKANLVKLSGYSTFSVRGSYHVSEQWAVEVHVDNVFDRQYSTAVDFSLGQYRAIGREAFVTLRYTPSF